MSSAPLLASVPNFRDLGGLAAADGRLIAPGRLFRSSHFAALSAPDEAQLAALGLRTIVDLRGVNERAVAPGRALRPGVEELHLPIEPRALGALRELRAAGTIDAGAVHELMHAAYRRFAAERTPVFAALLARLQDAACYPLVFHCTAGKDRTGFAAVLVLLALGVSREEIISDFMLSNELWKAREATQDWTVLSRVRTDYLQTAFDAMTAGWGSADAYLSGALGVDAAARARLAGHLLMDKARPDQ